MAAPVGSCTLPLLCRKARRTADNADVAANIRSFLVVDFSKLDPDWLTKCFLDFVQRAIPCLGSHVSFKIWGKVETAWLPFDYNPCWPDPEGDEAESHNCSSLHGYATADVKIRIGFWFVGRRSELYWYADLHAQPGHRFGTYDNCRPIGEAHDIDLQDPHIFQELMRMRKAFDRREYDVASCFPGTMQLPTTLAEWSEFFRRWLFGPEKTTKQTTLDKWRCPLTASAGEQALPGRPSSRG